MSGRKQRPGDQPLPIPNEQPDIQAQVMDDLAARREVGIARYGTALQPFNGRSALRDAYEEALDLCCYLKQLLVEDDAHALAAADPELAGDLRHGAGVTEVQNFLGGRA